jgi:hypothetical protein
MAISLQFWDETNGLWLRRLPQLIRFLHEKETHKDATQYRSDAHHWGFS